MAITQSSEDGSSVEAVDDEDPALDVHDHVRDGEVHDQLIARRPHVLIPSFQ